MKPEIKRFRVFDIDAQKKIGQFDSVAECVTILTPLWKTSKKLPSDGGNPFLDFMIDDVHDDIEINWAELMEAWEEGERPEDLQMF